MRVLTQPVVVLDRGRTLSSLPALLGSEGGPESFASHVDRAAAHQVYPLPITSLLARAGVMTQDRFDTLPYGYGVDLSAEEVSCFAEVFDLGEQQVRAMLMRHLDGRAFDLGGLDVRDPGSIRAVAAREWAGFAGSSCCPACLNETGGWRLHWKLWFNFVCLTHRMLLVNRCPRCQRHTGNYRADQGNAPRFATLVPRPGYCANPLAAGFGSSGRSARPCGQKLGEVVTVDVRDAPRLLETQRQVHSVLESGAAMVAGEGVPALAYFGQLRSLTALILLIAQPGDLGDLPPGIAEAAQVTFEDRDAVRTVRRGKKGAVHHPYKAPPSDLRMVAAVLPLACEILAQPDQDALETGLLPLFSRLRGWRGSSIRTVGREFHFRGALAVAFNDFLSGKATFDRSVGHLAGGEETGEYATFLPDHVPPLLWLELYRQNFAPLLDGLNIGECFARATVSMALVKLCGKYSWDESVTALGLNGFLTSGNSIRIMGHLKKHGRKEDFQKALHEVAAWLSRQTSPTDFRARRRALEHFDAVAADEWEVIAWATGFKGRKSLPLRRNAAAWVWAELTGSDPDFSPALSQEPKRQDSLREVYRRFERDDLPGLEFRLRQLVEEMEGRL